MFNSNFARRDQDARFRNRQMSKPAKIRKAMFGEIVCDRGREQKDAASFGSFLFNARGPT